MLNNCYSWTPAQFTGSHNAYANTIWYKNLNI